MTRKLPPLNALRAFEAAGRHLSFTKAATELNVTPAAISHQIKALEAWIGAPLFHRRSRALRLTSAGQEALSTLSLGFDTLAQAVHQMRASVESGVLTISVSPSFGALWLTPRLEDFRRLQPSIDIRLDGTDRLADLMRDDVDVALRYGPGGYKGARVDRLFGQVNTPVCSPALLTGENALRRPSDLSRHVLLHIEWKDSEASWRMWLLAAGLRNIDPTRGPRFSLESMALQAALDGQGVALIGDKLAADHLAAGALVRPFDPNLNTPLSFSYYLLSAETRADEPKIAAFRDWVLDQARRSQAEACDDG